MLFFFKYKKVHCRNFNILNNLKIYRKILSKSIDLLFCVYFDIMYKRPLIHEHFVIYKIFIYASVHSVSSISDLLFCDNVQSWACKSKNINIINCDNKKIFKNSLYLPIRRHHKAGIPASILASSV